MASRPLRPAIATKRAGCRAAPVLPPGVVRFPAPPTLPSLPVSPKRPSSARIASRPAACHAASLIKAYARRNPPLHRRKALPILSRSIAARKQAREKNSVPLHSQHPPSLLSGRMACLISNSRQTATGTFAPTRRKFFRGWGEHERGRGSFYKKRPFPSRHSPAPQPLHNKKSGAVTCTRFYRKNKGTWMCYFFSPLCLRLWPCCMK